MRQQRHASIREILEHASVTSQDELRKKLASRGFHVTQATLSRDVHALKLYKGPTGYAANAANADDEVPDTSSVMRSFGLKVTQAMNLLVVTTTTGAAQPIAASIDYEDWPEVVGTVAGDDTVLVICIDEEQALKLRARVGEYIG